MDRPNPGQTGHDRPLSGGQGRLIVDLTHCGRHVTGLERIALDLFSAEALAPFAVEAVRAGGRFGMMLAQNAGLPLRALCRPHDLVLCPGFPPAPLLTLLGDRVLPYVHDLFLLTRPHDLNVRAKLYMAAPFRLAVRRLPAFLVNSETTREALRGHCRPDARIVLYRPRVDNVFGLESAGRMERQAPGKRLRLVAIGTVEPRKNLLAAAAIVTALRAQGVTGASLDVLGRIGWGDDAAALAAVPGVTLHGYQPAPTVRRIASEADMFISTAHDEGLGLPLLEAQHGGLPVLAPDKPVFREVLGGSGLLIDPAQPAATAVRILESVAAPGWLAGQAAAAQANLRRWNRLASGDRANVMALISDRLAARMPVAATAGSRKRSA